MPESDAENILSVLQGGCFIRGCHIWRSGNPAYNSLTTWFCSHAYLCKAFSYFTEISREGKRISDFPEYSKNWWSQSTRKIPEFSVNLGLQFSVLAWVFYIKNIILFFLGIILEIVSLEQVLQGKFVEFCSARFCSQQWILNKRKFFLNLHFWVVVPKE